MKAVRSTGWLGLPALLAALLCACAHEEAITRDGPVVKSLDFKGNDEISSGDLESNIVTEEKSWIPFMGKPRLDRNVWRQDLKRIERYYQSQGYHRALIADSKIEELDEGKSVRLLVDIEEGKPTRIKTLTLTGLESIPEKYARISKRGLSLEEGDILVEESWNGVPGALRSRLVEFGYAEAKVEHAAQVDLATSEATLEVRVEPGVRYKVEDVDVHQPPNSRVEAWRIREQALEALEAFGHYSEEARLEVQQQLFAMGVFGSVQVTPGPGNPETGLLRLQIDVNEAPFHELAYGFGIGFQQRKQEAHVLAEYTHRDFLGKLRALTLRAEAGYAVLPSIFALTSSTDPVLQSGPIAKLQADFQQPRLFHPNLRGLTVLELEKAIEPAYAYVGGKGKVGVGWRPRSYFVIEPSYNFEVYRLDQGQTTLQQGAPQLLFGCDRLCILSYLEERLAYDRRDDQQEPKKGYYLGVSFQQGGGPFGGSFDYFRIVPEVRGYKSFLPGRKLTFGARMRIGTLIPLGGASGLDTPIVARFFSGGDQMRGFSTQRLSPMRLAPRGDAEQEFNAEQVPVGGNGLFEAGFETRYSLTQSLTLAGFLDTGAVTASRVPPNVFKWIGDNLLYAVGTGIRYRTPVGPIRLDVAYRLPFGPPLRVYDEPGLRYERTQGCFGIGKTSSTYGGSPEGLCSIHLSIGEAF